MTKDVNTIKKVMVLFGTRPEAIKMAPVIVELSKSASFEVVAVSSGQHRDMVKDVMGLFHVNIHHDLKVMKKGQTLVDVTTRVLLRVAKLIEKVKPDLILVHGDTTTAFAGALAGFYARIPVGHVEAGLRSGDMSAPFPEEMNRRFVGLVATLHFPPTKKAADNLTMEAAVYERQKPDFDGVKKK